MNIFNLQNSKKSQIRTFSCDALEANWYEDRCLSNFDKRKKKNYLMPSSYSWQFETTYNEMSDKSRKEFPSIKEKFVQSSNNYINYQSKDYNMYVTTTNHAYDPRYKESFRQPIKQTDYYKNRQHELEEYRKTWTKRSHLIDSTYKADILAKTGSTLISSNKLPVK
jgi:hypothetical protein